MFRKRKIPQADLWNRFCLATQVPSDRLCPETSLRGGDHSQVKGGGKQVEFSLNNLFKKSPEVFGKG